MQFRSNGDAMETTVGFGDLVISANDELGYRPFQLMVASIVGCSGSVFKKILKKQRIEFEELTIDADVKRNPDEADRIERIILSFTIKGENLDKEKLKKNLAIARKNCSMARSVENSIEIEETIEVVE
ncbi:OsmC family protein [Virgibacillus halophilus]|uniref:OsmC family protein n=1 Tax=Tigheibacillus halophilus TaxID=361280 RepID=UPI00363CA7D7